MPTTTSTTATPVPVGASPFDPPGWRGLRRLLIALLACCAYAAFWHGATDLPAETRLQVAVAAIALVAAVVFVAGPIPPPAPATRTLVGLGLFTGFVVWAGLSLLWSVAPNDTWIELNRSIAYLLVLVVALAIGARARRAPELVSTAWLGIATAVAIWALAGKVVPWIAIGPFDFDQTALFSRLRAPLGYWNALGLVCAMAAPAALRMATDAGRLRPGMGWDARVRTRGLRALTLLMVTLGLTYSRGGVLALAVGMTVAIWLGGSRLRALGALAVAALAALPALVSDFASHALTTDHIAQSQRVVPGLILGALLAGSLAALGPAWRRLENRSAPAVLRTEAARRGIYGVLALAVVVLLASGFVSDQLHSFTETRALAVSDPARLLSSNSGNRWVWWKEAAGAFSDRPLEGWGAGSFPLVHLLYRKPPPLPVNQPHSVPLQFLAETGLVGAVLALGGLLALLSAALAAIRRMPHGRERDLAAACAAAALAWLVHGLVDWDFDIPGVTVPALLLLGVAAAVSPGVRAAPRRTSRIWPPPWAPPAIVLAAVTFAAVVASAVFPAWSQSKGRAALSQAANAHTPAQLQAAQATAELAARLDPLAVDPLLYAAAIAQRRYQPVQARADLLRAVDRQPDNPPTWYRLVQFGLAVNDRRGAERAAAKLVSLDPVEPLADYYGTFGDYVAALPQDSPTAVGTPVTGR